MKTLRIAAIFLVISALALSAYSQFLSAKSKRLDDMTSKAEQKVQNISMDMKTALR